MEPTGHEKDADTKKENTLQPMKDITSPPGDCTNEKVQHLLSASTASDVSTVRKLSISNGGIISDECRRAACKWKCCRGMQRLKFP